MQTLGAWLILMAVLVVPYGWAGWLSTRGGRPFDRLLALTLTPGLAIGSLTLIMFWESLLGVPLTVFDIVRPYAALHAIGLVLWWRQPAKQATPLQAHFSSHWMGKLAALAVLGICVATLFNAVYWPFSRYDTLGIYHPQAVEIANRAALLPLTGADSLYLAYPMQMQLAYAFTYIASGWENAYLARVLPALLSIGALAATYLVGRAVQGKFAGWIGMLLLATMPAFARWASTGYVDLPMAYFYTLAALFAWRLWQEDHPIDALLAGLLVGLAAWTKNAALIGVVLLAAWLVWGVINRQISLRSALISMLTCAVIGAPWYIRNQIGAGFIMPDTAWTDQAQRSLETLLIFVTRWLNYGIAGFVILAAVAAALTHLVRRRLRAPEDALLVGWTLPFFIIWWLLASYDPRFLLLFIPLLCALAGRWSAQAWAKLSAAQRHPLIILGALVLVALTIYTMWISVEFKRAILQDPLMDHAAKLAIVQPTRAE